MTPMKRRDERGVGVVEVLLVLAMLGVAASYAWPRYVEHRRRVAMVEATRELGRIAAGAQTYYARTAGGSRLPLLPASSSSWVPKVTLHERCASGATRYAADLDKQFDGAPWSALGFAPGAPLAFRYHYLLHLQTSKTRGAEAVAYALGDLGCDGHLTRWRVILRSAPGGGGGKLTRRGPELVAR